MIELVIDELVVRGLSPGDARTAVAALEVRLAALASETPALHARDEASRRLAPVSAPSPEALGEAVAGAVWRTVAR